MDHEPKPIVHEVDEELHPPVSQVPWSPDLVGQSIEILPIYSAGDSIFWLKPIHADSLRIGWPIKQKPSEAVLAALSRYGITPRVAHSTSWRQDEDRLVLTYVAIIDSPDGENQNLVSQKVARSELARGQATDAPALIEMGQVVEHALRHLAWLLHDDPVIGQELSGWQSLLVGYAPEPFRSFRADG